MTESYPWLLFLHPHVWLLGTILAGIFLVLWAVHLRVDNASLADVGFCVGFVGLVIYCGITGEGSVWRRWLVGGMGTAYGVRLGWHLFTKRVAGKREDARYRKVRQALGAWEQVGILGYFLVQWPACMVFAALPCWVMAHPATDWRVWDLVGVAVFLIAFVGETVADGQLEEFRSQPSNQGTVLQSGLWRYSRHPNYFFETLLWCAYVPLAIGLSWGWMAILWPGLMMVSLLWVTGVPWAEAQALSSRGEAYRRYQQTTNRFIPGRPRSSRGN